MAQTTKHTDAELIAACDEWLMLDGEERALVKMDPGAPDKGPNHDAYCALGDKRAQVEKRLAEMADGDMAPGSIEALRRVACVALADWPTDNKESVIVEDFRDAIVLMALSGILELHTPDADCRLVRLAERAAAAHQTSSIEFPAWPQTPGIARADEARTGAADARFWRTIDAMKATPATSMRGMQAKAETLLLLLRRSVTVQQGQTLDDIAAGKVGEPVDQLALSLARDVLAGRPMP